MKNNARRLAGFLLAVCACFGLAGGAFAARQSAALLDALCAADGAAGPQEWLDGVLAAHPIDGREWFVFSLRAAPEPYDFSAYAAALQPAVAADDTAGAVTQQKYALLRLACGERDVPVPPDSINDRAVMSLIYGLHLLHNGCAWPQTAAQVAGDLLALQKEDGGWAVIGNYGDVDVTAMAIQALAPLYREPAVREAVDRALALLAAKQLDDGTFKSFGAVNAESTAQVVLALAALGRDPLTEPGFCEKTDLLSALLSFRLPNGLFAHAQGGEVSLSACAQVLMALTAVERVQAGESGNLYLFTDTPAPTGASTTPTSATDPTMPTTTAPTSATPTTTTGPAESGAPSLPFRWLAAAAAVLIAGLICLLLWLTGRRHGKHFLSVALVLALVLGAIFLVDIRPADGRPDTPAQQPVGRVTLSVRCDTVAGLAADGTTPADGVILPRTDMPLYDGDTVYDVLQRTGLRIDHRGGKVNAYVAGINDLREQQYGELSGWMFFVNGVSPSVGCGSYALHDGDAVEWLYSTNMGEDLPPKGEDT